MVTRGTVDEAIYSLQERKERMNEAIMDEKGAKKKNDDNMLCRWRVIVNDNDKLE